MHIINIEPTLLHESHHSTGLLPSLALTSCGKYIEITDDMHTMMLTRVMMARFDHSFESRQTKFQS